MHVMLTLELLPVNFSTKIHGQHIITSRSIKQNWLISIVLLAFMFFSAILEWLDNQTESKGRDNHNIYIWLLFNTPRLYKKGKLFNQNNYEIFSHESKMLILRLFLINDDQFYIFVRMDLTEDLITTHILITWNILNFNTYILCVYVFDHKWNRLTVLSSSIQIKRTIINVYYLCCRL